MKSLAEIDIIFFGTGSIWKATVQTWKIHFTSFFFYERGSVSMYDRQVDTLIKLSTFEKYVYFNQPIKILEICPNSLLSHGILSYFEHQKNNR